jgi:hypothetical protein
MSSAPFLVLNRSNRRVIHQAASLAEARGFSEGHPRPCAIAIIAEVHASSEMQFCIELVNCDTGRVLARTVPLDFDEETDEFLMAKILLVPACLSKGGAT